MAIRRSESWRSLRASATWPLRIAKGQREPCRKRNEGRGSWDIASAALGPPGPLRHIGLLRARSHLRDPPVRAARVQHPQAAFGCVRVQVPTRIAPLSAENRSRLPTTKSQRRDQILRNEPAGCRMSTSLGAQLRRCRLIQAARHAPDESTRCHSPSREFAQSQHGPPCSIGRLRVEQDFSSTVASA
jgi:hypothetical protein